LNVPLDAFLDHFGDGGVAAASARIVAAVKLIVSERNHNGYQHNDMADGYDTNGSTLENAGSVTCVVETTR